LIRVAGIGVYQLNDAPQLQKSYTYRIPRLSCKKPFATLSWPPSQSMRSTTLHSFYSFIFSWGCRRLSYPPGLPSQPIIGNHRRTPLPILILAFQGDILCLRYFGQVVVVLCSYGAIKNLLDKRGETHADRPMLPIVEMCAE
jgi:hypothetical protein